ncbi:MAG TPA: DHH family phosphoesterase [Methanospirillum sp.]|jgi:RecJ-like exonuclease|uniref:DHH family phosphoesterase n=1 Tax=Methanospirillum sp. TaxID=45200 RepID=UPI0009CF884A|nr:DHH family phosphoesterase [Methanospirillum sp.]OQB38929.1 MAG: DHH family protein [Euryarchaeota archaeon ADurb.Bin165]HPY59908.1 DHH family phosphoesterase [Methanospirillum sp.]
MSFSEDIRAAADAVRSCREVTIISHIDADGISSEAILAMALSREGIHVSTTFVRQLDPLTLDQVPDDSSLKIFSDLGSGQQQMLMEKGLDPSRTIIIDHHVSQPADHGDPFIEVNCLNHGHEKMSAAGVSYLVAREIDSINTDLAKLAVIGNVGDMMDREHLRLTGPAREILLDGIRHGTVEMWERDLNIYGISTRPLPQSLAYSDDMDIPGVSRDIDGAAKFLERIGITPLQPNRWPVWEDLSFDQKQLVCSAVIEQMVAHGKDTSRLFSDHYLFPDEDWHHAPLRNASEFATMLNSCGRWQRPELGGAICRGDRVEAYREAEHMLRNHRSKIREVMMYITDTGVSELSHMLHIHVGGRFPDTIVGIGAGMALSRLNPEKPILIMCEDSLDPSMTKISMRTRPEVVKKGVDLQLALAQACEGREGCSGGGHRIAAGAFIPRDHERAFIEDVNRILAQQYAQSCQDHR